MRVVLLICLLFAACGIFKPYDVSDVKAITWDMGGIQYNGKGSQHEITFRADGTAEKSDETFEHDFPKTGDVIHKYRSEVTPEQFRRLAETIAGRGFFSKQSHPVNDAWENITIINAKGETHLSVIDQSDPDNKAMVQAVQDLAGQLKWEESTSGS
jgi:hypothetical protein